MATAAMGDSTATHATPAAPSSFADSSPTVATRPACAAVDSLLVTQRLLPRQRRHPRILCASLPRCPGTHKCCTLSVKH